MKTFTLDEFAQSRFRTLWIRDHGLKIYVRKNLLYPGLYDLADMHATVLGEGCYTRFLDHYEDRYPIHIDQCSVPRLADFHRARGWVELFDDHAPSFLNRLAVDRGLGNLRLALR